MTDRTYWHVLAPEARSWHAQRTDGERLQWAPGTGACGRHAKAQFEMSDRVPVKGHLCGHCARSIAAQTDIEA